MSAELIVRSDIPPVDWAEFTSDYPPYSIALDGFVSAGPHYSPSGPHLNANHHEGVDRLATLSTAQQIHMNLRMGMDKAFQQDGEFSAKVWVNDCDQDVCTAWYLLEHCSEVKSVRNPMLNRFVQVAGVLDATAGAFPYDRNHRVLGELAWVFEPYSDFRNSGDMENKENPQYETVIRDVGKRITEHLMGKGETVPLDTRYEIIGGGQTWRMISEQGKDGRVGAFLDGIDAYVTVKESKKGGSWRYTIGRRSEFIPFDVPVIMNLLNEAEMNPRERWGGSDIIGGSPRVSGSKLPPDVVERIINDYLATI